MQAHFDGGMLISENFVISFLSDVPTNGFDHSENLSSGISWNPPPHPDIICNCQVYWMAHKGIANASYSITKFAITHTCSPPRIYIVHKSRVPPNLYNFGHVRIAFFEMTFWGHLNIHVCWASIDVIPPSMRCECIDCTEKCPPFPVLHCGMLSFWKLGVRASNSYCRTVICPLAAK